MKKLAQNTKDNGWLMHWKRLIIYQKWPCVCTGHFAGRKEKGLSASEQPDFFERRRFNGFCNGRNKGGQFTPVRSTEHLVSRYSACSIEIRENIDFADAFLNRFPEVTVRQSGASVKNERTLTFPRFHGSSQNRASAEACMLRVLCRQR